MRRLVHVGFSVNQQLHALEAILTRREYQRGKATAVFVRLPSKGGKCGGFVGFRLKILFFPLPLPLSSRFRFSSRARFRLFRSGFSFHGRNSASRSTTGASTPATSCAERRVQPVFHGWGEISPVTLGIDRATLPRCLLRHRSKLSWLERVPVPQPTLKPLFRAVYPSRLCRPCEPAAL